MRRTIRRWRTNLTVFAETSACAHEPGLQRGAAGNRSRFAPRENLFAAFQRRTAHAGREYLNGEHMHPPAQRARHRFAVPERAPEAPADPVPQAFAPVVRRRPHRGAAAQAKPDCVGPGGEAVRRVGPIARGAEARSAPKRILAGGDGHDSGQAGVRGRVGGPDLATTGRPAEPGTWELREQRSKACCWPIHSPEPKHAIYKRKHNASFLSVVRL